jgi:hypothetical protein
MQALRLELDPTPHPQRPTPPSSLINSTQRHHTCTRRARRPVRRPVTDISQVVVVRVQCETCKHQGTSSLVSVSGGRGHYLQCQISPSSPCQLLSCCIRICIQLSPAPPRQESSARLRAQDERSTERERAKRDSLSLAHSLAKRAQDESTKGSSEQRPSRLASSANASLTPSSANTPGRLTATVHLLPGAPSPAPHPPLPDPLLPLYR